MSSESLSDRLINCRILPCESSDGPGNMALDETMLEAVADDPSSAIFRTYLWSEPTLSLGYFQSIALIDAEPRWRNASVVRRPTGGGALWHHHEVTYAVVIPATHPLARRSRDLYVAVHAAIVGVLESTGINASRRGDSVPGATKPFLCFADRDPEDVVSGSIKIVGSAQRRRSGAVLQHGSLLLSGSPTTPELPGLTDLAKVDADPALWSSRLEAAIPSTLGLEGFHGPITSSERRRADELAKSVYRSSAWTCKR